MLPFTGKLLGESYYSHARPDLARLIPKEAQSILDVGCAGGALGACVKARQECFYAGIERDHNAVKIARKVLDKVIYGDVDSIYPGEFSFVVTCVRCYQECLASLEHVDH